MALINIPVSVLNVTIPSGSTSVPSHGNQFTSFDKSVIDIIIPPSTISIPSHGNQFTAFPVSLPFPEVSTPVPPRFQWSP